MRNATIVVFLSVLLFFSMHLPAYAFDLGVGGGGGMGLPAAEFEAVDSSGLAWGGFVQFLFLEASYHRIDLSSEEVGALFDLFDLAFRYNILERRIRPYLLGGVGYAEIAYDPSGGAGVETTKGADFFFGGGLDLRIGSLGPIDITFGLSVRSHFLLTQNGEITLSPEASPQELGRFTHVTSAMAGLSLWLF